MIEGTPEGLLVGLILTWLLLFSAVAVAIRVNGDRVPRDRSRECPMCRMRIRREANVCQHCHRDVVPMRFHEGHWWTTDDQGRPMWLDDQTGRWERLPEPDPEPAPARTRKRST